MDKKEYEQNGTHHRKHKWLLIKNGLARTQKMGVGIVAVVLIGIGGVAYGLYHKTASNENNSTISSSNSSDSSNNQSSSITANADWLTIGIQTWAKTNLNVGTMIIGTTDQTNNATLEKYCYADTESNCTTHGGLYQWNEMMQYVTTEGSQGICPAGSHIPTDNDWKMLEVQLGMSHAQADATGWRGTDQGTQLKSGGSSGLNMPLAGYRGTDGSFRNLSSGDILWSSSNGWFRLLNSSYATVSRGANAESLGFSVRCLGN